MKVKKRHKGKKVLMRLNNSPLGLTIGDEYGIIEDVTKTHIVVKRFDSKVIKYAKHQQSEVFFRWFNIEGS